jgi:hypothetical protein
VDFSVAIRKQLSGEIVRVSHLAEFEFKSGTIRLWGGHFVFDSGGKKWHPTMGIGQVTGIAQSTNGTAPEIRFELSGVDHGFISKAQGSVNEYYNRIVTVYWQFWDENWQVLGVPRAITWGLMRSIISNRKALENGTAASLTLTAETPFEGRARARHSYVTDRDQQTRHPGDLICSRIAGIEAREVTFPAF